MFSLRGMDDEKLTNAVNKLADLQVRTLGEMAWLRAQIEVIHIQLSTLAFRGEAPEDKREACADMTDDLRKRYARKIAALKQWLVEKEIASPPPDDPWWDRPTE